MTFIFFIQYFKVVMNWLPFFYSPMQVFPQQFPFYAMPNLITMSQDISSLQKPESLVNSGSSFHQNQEKLQLTEEDLKNQTYQTNKKAWSQEEDKKLRYLYDRKKLTWEQIAKKIPERNKKMCYSRYRRLENGTKIQWTREDNQKLRFLVNESGENWKLISQHFQGRNSKQIKQHYKNYVRPDIDKSEWCLQDDLRLIELIQGQGRNWRLIQVEMPHRSLNQIKNRFFGKLKKLNAQLYGEEQAV